MVKSGIWKRVSWGVTAGDTSGVNVCTASAGEGHGGFAGAAYGIIFAHGVPLVKEGVLLIQVLEVAGRVAMHFGAVWGWGDALVWAVYLVWGVGIGRGGGGVRVLLRQGIVEQVGVGVWGLGHGMAVDVCRVLGSVGGMLVIRGQLWGKLGLEVVDVERVGQIGELVSSRGGSVGVVGVNVEVQVEIVKVNKLCAGKVVWRCVHVEAVCCSPGLRSRVVHVGRLLRGSSDEGENWRCEDRRVGLARRRLGGGSLVVYMCQAETEARL